MTSFQDIVKKDTWEKGLPMIYVDNNNRLIKHYKCGKIIVIKQLENE